MPCCDTGRNIQKYKGAAASTLQDVTDNGNTTTGDIITTSGFFIGDGSKLTNVPGVSGAAFTLQQTTNKGNVTTDTVEFQNSITSLTASGNVLVTGNVTASVFYGDGGLLSNTATTPTLQTVTTIGNTTTNTIDFQNSVTSLTTSGNVLVTGNVTASKFYGDGLGLTSLNATNVSTGTLLVARGGTGTTTSTGSGSVVLNTNPTLSGTVTAGTFSGSGSGLTSLNAGNISTGTLPVARGGTGATTLNNLIQMGTHTTGNYVATITGGDGIASTGATSGETIAHTLSVDRKANGGLVIENGQLAVNLGASAITGTLAVSDGGTGVTSSTGSGSVVLNTNPTFSGTVQGGTFSGSGSGLTSLNAGNISTGTLPVARGGTGATTLNNLIQMGTHTTGNYVATITGGDGISSTGATSGETIAHTLSVDTKANGGLVIENNQLAVNLGASAITGTLAVSDGGTGVTSSTGSGSVVLNTNPTFSGTVTAGTFSGSGSGLTSLNASNITTGTLPVARGGTNITTYAKGDILIASATNTLSKLSLGTGGYVLTSNTTTSLPEWKSSSDLGTQVAQLSNSSYILGGLYNGITARTWSVQASTSNTSNYIVARDSSGDIFVSNVNAIQYYGDGGTLSNIVGSQNLQQVIVENPYTNSPPYFGAGSYGAIYGSNTISASTISASSLVSPHFVGSSIYGGIIGQNTVSASTITTTDTISTPRVSASSYVSGVTVISSSSGGIYGPIKGSNTITTSGIYGPIYGSNTITTSGVYGPIKGSNTITTSGVYGPIKGSNTITTSGVYGPIKGSNTITGSTLNVNTLISDDASAINSLNASNINSGTLSNAYGGTGFTSYSQGDLLVGTGSGSNLKKLSRGASNYVLTVNGSGNDIEWQPGSGNISLDQVVEVSNSTSNVVQFTGADYDTSFVTSKKVGIANTAPTHTLDVGEVFSVVNSTSGGDVLILRGNAYFNDELYIAKKLTVPASGEILADTIKCRSLSTKGTIVVNERRESIVRID